MISSAGSRMLGLYGDVVVTVVRRWFVRGLLILVGVVLLAAGAP